MKLFLSVFLIILASSTLAFAGDGFNFCPNSCDGYHMCGISDDGSSYGYMPVSCNSAGACITKCMIKVPLSTIEQAKATNSFNGSLACFPAGTTYWLDTGLCVECLATKYPFGFWTYNGMAMTQCLEQQPSPVVEANPTFQTPNASAWLEALIRNYTATGSTIVNAESSQIAPTGTITLNDGRPLTNSSTAINFIMPTLVSCPTNLAIDWLDERCEAPIACDPNYSFVATLGVCQLNPGSVGLIEVSPVYQLAPVGLCQVGGATILASESACSGYAGQFSPLAGAISDPATSLSAIGWCQDQGLVTFEQACSPSQFVLAGYASQAQTADLSVQIGNCVISGGNIAATSAYCQQLGGGFSPVELRGMMARVFYYLTKMAYI